MPFITVPQKYVTFLPLLEPYDPSYQTIALSTWNNGIIIAFGCTKLRTCNAARFSVDLFH